MTDKVQATLHEAFENAKSYKPKTSDWLSSYWSGFMSPSQLSRIRNTGVPMDLLKVGLGPGVSQGVGHEPYPMALAPMDLLKVCLLSCFGGWGRWGALRKWRIAGADMKKVHVGWP